MFYNVFALFYCVYEIDSKHTQIIKKIQTLPMDFVSLWLPPLQSIFSTALTIPTHLKLTAQKNEGNPYNMYTSYVPYVHCIVQLVGIYFHGDTQGIDLVWAILYIFKIQIKKPNLWRRHIRHNQTVRQAVEYCTIYLNPHVGG